MDKLRDNRFEIVLASLVMLILSPLLAMVLHIEIRFLNLFGISLLSIASLIMAIRKIERIITGTMGILTLLLVWLEFLQPSDSNISLLRMYAMLGLFILLAIILIRNFIDAEEVSPRMIFGAVSGFLLIGFVGGVLFEILNYVQEGAVFIESASSGFDIYYYSFISMITVGYGDIVPVTGAAKSLTIILSLCGQLYMTIGIATFVGKHMSSLNKIK